MTLNREDVGKIRLHGEKIMTSDEIHKRYVANLGY